MLLYFKFLIHVTKIKPMKNFFICLYPVIMVLFWGCNNSSYTKMMRYGIPDVYDYKIFPARKLTPSNVPFNMVKDTLTNTQKLWNLQQSTGLYQQLERNQTLSFLVIRNDTIVMEKYFKEADSSFYTQSFSMSKSIVSLLVGCAIDDNLIRSEHDLVISYIPEYKERGFKNITLLDLLNMTAPVNYREVDNPFGKHARMYYSPHLEKDILKLTARENGEKKFVYRSCNTAILGLVLKRALKNETVTAYLQRKIWQPLGMENPGLWNIDHDPDGLERTWCCISGTARDFSKIALLYLHKGKWGNHQIVSENWINKTIAPLYGKEQTRYNYSWWFVPENKAYSAIGRGGQYAYIVPDKNMVIVRIGEKNGEMRRDDWYKLFARFADSF